MDESPKNRDALWLIALVAVAFMLRAQQIDLVYFNIDESIAASVASQIGAGVRYPLTGIETSFGFHNPPLFLYLLAPFFAASADPRVPMTFFALLGALATIAVWRAGDLLAGRRCAWIAAVLFAVSPNAAEHARRLWGHDLILPCAALSLWGALAALRGGGWKPLAGSFVGAAAAQCFHLSGALLWLPGLAVHFAAKPEKRWLALGIGAASLFALYLPWLISDARANFEETKLILSLLGGGRLGVDYELPIGPAPSWALLLGDGWWNDALGGLPPWRVSMLAGAATVIVSLGAVMMLGGGMMRLGIAATREKEERIAVAVIALPLLATPFLFGIIARSVVPPYQLPALVPMALAAGWALSGLSEKYMRGMIAALVIFAVASIALAFETRRGIAEGMGSSPHLRERMQVVRVMEDLAARRHIDVAQDGRNPDTGLDIAWVYLMYWGGMGGLAANEENPAAMAFVIVDHTSKIRPQVMEFFRRQNHTEFEHVTLYYILPNEMREWRRLLEEYPAPMR